MGGGKAACRARLRPTVGGGTSAAAPHRHHTVPGKGGGWEGARKVRQEGKQQVYIYFFLNQRALSLRQSCCSRGSL